MMASSKAGFENADCYEIRLDQISQVPEVTSDSRFDEIRYAGVSMVSTLNYFLDLLCQTLGEIDCVVFVLAF